ncbi:MAG: hypothetical protein J5626_03725, partial [Lachnospiraceae bacterium]|nr:hypothetical protein [Lachnospiraceae bacterium]
EIRDSLLYIDLLLVFWIFARIIKFDVVSEPVAVRYLWYFYYVPQIFTAYFTFVIVDHMRNENKVSHKRRCFLVGLVSAAFSVLVMTNEFHNFVFKIDPATGTERHSFGYFLVAFWLLIVSFVSVFFMPGLRKNKNLLKKLWLPLSCMVLTVAYCVLYFVPAAHIVRDMLDYTVAMCLGTVGTWEALIFTGIVPTNRDYEWCFNHSTVRAQITDIKGNIKYRSFDARPVLASEFEVLRKTRLYKVDRDTELVMAPIRGGFVVTERDVKEINRLMSRLFETQSYIRDVTDSLRASIEIEKRQKNAAEKNRLYDLTFSKVQERVTRLEGLIEEAKGLSGETFFKKLFLIDIIGVFVKRKSNLIILTETGLADYSGELKLCFKETFDNLKEGGVDGGFLFNNVDDMSNTAALLIYETLETVIEATLEGATLINAILTWYGGDYSLTVSVENECIKKEFKIDESLFPEEVVVNIENGEGDATVSALIRGRGDWS